MKKIPMGGLLLVVSFGLVVGGCSGGDDAADPVECCMLKKIADHCDTSNSTTSLQEHVQKWRSVGESGNAEACKSMIDNDDNGCSGPSLSYDESDAVVDCK
jgi:hypothetical protein